MDINLHSTDKFRISTERGKNFIDVSGMEFEIGLSVSLFPTFNYIEIRKHGNDIEIFIFRNKIAKKYYDFGEYWKDAEIVYSLNKVRHE